MVEFDTESERTVAGEQSLVGFTIWDLVPDNGDVFNVDGFTVKSFNIAPDQSSIILNIDRFTYDEAKDYLKGLYSNIGRKVEDGKVMITSFNKLMESRPKPFKEADRYVETRTQVVIRNAGMVEENAVREEVNVHSLGTIRGDIVSTTDVVFLDSAERIMDQTGISDKDLVFGGSLFDVEDEVLTT